jgi:hypothetical protein
MEMSLRFRHIWPIKCHERRVLAVLLVAKASESVVSTALQGGLRAKAQPFRLVRAKACTNRRFIELTRGIFVCP